MAASATRKGKSAGTRRPRRPPPKPTAPPRTPLRRLKLARAGRQAALAVLVAFLALGLTGLWGSKTSAVSATAHGFDLTVHYPSATRPGLPVQLIVRVRHAGGFSAPVRIATSAEYLTRFDVNDLQPQPASSTATGDLVIWEFDPPQGDTFTLRVDAATEPGEHGGTEGAVTSVLRGEAVLVDVRYDTRFVP